MEFWIDTILYSTAFLRSGWGGHEEAEKGREVAEGDQERLGQILREAHISMLPRLLAGFVTFSPFNSDIWFSYPSYCLDKNINYKKES